MARYHRGWSSGWRKSLSAGGREWYDSSWELQYMDELDRDALVTRWTRHHGLGVPYRKTFGRRGMYEPDFLVELVDGAKELREVKGEHLFSDANTALKLRAGDEFCRRRGMKYRVITKSPVSPDAWTPSTWVATEDGPSAVRPELAEDAYVVQQKTGCAGLAAAIVAVVALAFVCVLIAAHIR